jgi:gamma-glutamylcyclotransferase (GGCT)/AIG2-like uncharacterized protein YtfP
MSITEAQKKDSKITKEWAEKVTKENPLNKLYSDFAFYGSLREGQYNHNYLIAPYKDSVKVETVELKGYKMFSFGAYPFVVKSEDAADSIVVELHTIPNEMPARRIHFMELGAGYGAEEVIINDKAYCLYVYPDRNWEEKGYEKVPEGDWVKFNNKK